VLFYKLYYYSDKMRAMRIMLLFAVLVLLSGTAASADWPMFGHDPQHTGVADESVEPPLELLWEFNINSSTASSPVVSGGTVYIVAFRLNNSYLYALDAVTGAEKWKWKCEPTSFLFGVPSPAVHNDTVYVYTPVMERTGGMVMLVICMRWMPQLVPKSGNTE